MRPERPSFNEQNSQEPRTPENTLVAAHAIGVEYNRTGDFPDPNLLTALDHIEQGYRLGGNFEFNLLEAGILEKLTSSGVIPTVEDPNPYDPENEEHLHNQWWDEHPQETQEWIEINRQRSKIVQALYIGSLIGVGMRELVPNP